jgi:hypothetical protein
VAPSGSRMETAPRRRVMTDGWNVLVLSGVQNILAPILQTDGAPFWKEYEFYGTLLMLCVVVFAAIATYFSRRSAVASEASVRAATEFQQRAFLLTMMRRYHEPEMADAVRRVRRLPKTYSTPDDFIRARDGAAAALNGQPRDALTEGERTALLFDDARRMVKSYFLEIGELLIAGLMDGATARVAAARYGVALFFQVVQPIEKADGSREQAKYERVRKLLVDETLLSQYGLERKDLWSWEEANRFPTAPDA